MLDDEGWVTNDGAQELFFGYLFEVGEAELREKFLCDSMLVWLMSRSCSSIPYSEPNPIREPKGTDSLKLRRRRLRFDGM